MQFPHPEKRTSPGLAFPAMNAGTAGSVGFGLFLSLCLLFSLPAASMLAGGSIYPCYFYISLFCGLMCACFCGPERNLRKALKAAALYTALTSLSLLMAWMLPDFSYDGLGYHQYSVFEMSNGWNPWHSPPSEVVWTNHYAKGLEIMEASVYVAIGSIEASKGVNMILMLSASLLFAATAGMPWQGKAPARKTVWLLTLLMAFNPVGIAQLETFYIDYAKYYLWIITLTGAVWAYRCNGKPGRNAGAALVAGASLLAFAIKFNIAFEQALLLIVICAWGAATAGGGKFTLRIICASFSAAAIAAVLCSHPYITNWMDHGHPLYPLMGEGKIDIMNRLTPEVYVGADRFRAFLTTLFSRYVPPLYDTAIGGFGPFGGIVIILTLYAWIRYRKSVPRFMTLLCLFVAASCFFYPQSWWARYICQLWLIPVAVFSSLLLQGHSRRLGLTVTILAIMNGSCAFGREIYESLRLKHRQQTVIEACGGAHVVMKGSSPQHRVRACELGAAQVREYDPLRQPQDSALSPVPWTNNSDAASCVMLTTDQMAAYDSLWHKSRLSRQPND